MDTTLKIKNTGTKTILTFLRLVLTLNNFDFNSQNYLEIKGCAMGAKCAPSHTTIFMVMLEERYIYPLIEKISNFYLWFIDDFFLIWTGTIDQVMKVKQRINDVHPFIKLDYNVSNKGILSFIKHNQVKWKLSSTKKTSIDRLIYIVNQNTLSL